MEETPPPDLGTAKFISPDFWDKQEPLALDSAEDDPFGLDPLQPLDTNKQTDTRETPRVSKATPRKKKSSSSSSTKKKHSKTKSTSSRKKSKSKKKKEEPDNIRPPSQQHLFDQLQTQKFHHRQEASNAQQHHTNHCPNSQDFLQSPTNMAPSTAAKLRKAEEEWKALEEKLVEAQAQLSQSTQKKTSIYAAPQVIIATPYQPSAAEKKVVVEASKSLYRNVKFISNQTEADRATDLVRMALKLKHDSQEERSGWILTFKKLVVEALSSQRNYTQSRMKTLALKWLEDGHDDLPPSELILKCATREIHLADVEETAVFAWYWHHLLQADAGCADWGPKVTKTTTISNARCKEYPDKKAVTLATEAFVVLVYENCRDKWVGIRDYFRDNPTEKKLPQRTKDNKDLAYNKSKYTDQNLGQQPFGGWTSDGLERFNAIKKLIKDAKKTGDHVKLETDYLAMVIKAEPQQVDKKTKKKMTKKRKIVDTFDDEDFE